MRPSEPVAKTTLLVIADSTNSSSDITDCLKNTYEIKLASTFEKSRDALIAFRPTLIIIDIGAPFAERFMQVLKEVEELERSALLLVCDGNENLKSKLLALKADDFINRPIFEHDLQFRVKNLLEQVASNRRDDLIFQSMDEGLCTIKMIFDEQGKPIDYLFLDTNRAFETNTGLTKVKGKLVKSLLPDHEQHWFEIYGKVAITGESIRLENEAKALKRWYSIYAFRVGAPQEHCVAVIFDDVTRQKESEAKINETSNKLAAAYEELAEINKDLEKRVIERTQELELARNMAIKTNELKSQFVASISHEIRTPMAGILGLSELLQEEAEGDNRITATNILRSAQKLMNLVNDLLDMSKLEANRIDIMAEPFALDHVVKEVINAAEILTKNKNVKLSCDIAPELKRHVTGDPHRLRQILQNLVQNAIKFTDEGEVAVSVLTQRDDDKKMFVNFVIKDTGCGISSEDQKKLFNMFVQVDGSNKRKYGGTGLGLFLSKQLVELMGGSIGVNSQPGLGSVFWFTIPFKIS
jgi:signal transduction histidine kinase/DNA-binding response OmpR family regulator